MSTRPTLLNGCGMAATAAEARFRINGPNPPARAARIVALDRGAAAVISRAAQQRWQGAHFFTYEPGSPGGDRDGSPPDIALRAPDGSHVRLSEALAGADMTVMVATAEDGAEAASVVGEICGRLGIMTTGLVFGQGRAPTVVSVGDTVGVNLWGQSNPLEVTMDQMILVCQAVRRGVQRALVSCDFPYGPLQEGTGSAVRAAIRLVKQAGVDLVKLDGAADFLDAVSAIARAGIPVFAQLGITPQTALRYGVEYGAMSRPGAEVPVELTGDLIAEAKRLEEAGACLLDFTNSGPIVGPEVTRAVSIPVLGGFGGGPWLDGRMRMAHAAIGYAASAVRSRGEARRADRQHRRDRDTVRGHGLGSPAAHVLAGRVRRDPRQLDGARQLPPPQPARPPDPAVHLHRLRQA